MPLHGFPNCADYRLRPQWQGENCRDIATLPRSVAFKTLASLVLEGHERAPRGPASRRESAWLPAFSGGAPWRDLRAYSIITGLVTVLLLWIAILGARLIRLSRVWPREPAL
jgi:hypothetical protein